MMPSATGHPSTSPAGIEICGSSARPGRTGEHHGSSSVELERLGSLIESGRDRRHRGNEHDSARLERSIELGARLALDVTSRLLVVGGQSSRPLETLANPGTKGGILVANPVAMHLPDLAGLDHPPCSCPLLETPLREIPHDRAAEELGNLAARRVECLRNPLVGHRERVLR